MSAARSLRTLIDIFFVSSLFIQPCLSCKLGPDIAYELRLYDFSSATHFLLYFDVDTCESSLAGYPKLLSIQLLHNSTF